MINHKHKFIFIHIPKTGGTSIEHLFNIDPLKYDPGILVGKHPDSSNNEWLQHMTLRDMQIKYSINTNEYYIFTCVRNPWSRSVSSYYYERQLNSIPPRTSFKTFVQNPTYSNNQHSLSQYDYIVDHKNIPNVSFVMRLETLQQDFDIVCDKIGIPQQQLPHKNKNKHRPYTEYYDDETREIVAERYARDIKYFNYKFGI